MEPSRNTIPLLSDSFKRHKKKRNKKRYDNTCDESNETIPSSITNEVIETIPKKKRKKEQFVADREFESSKVPIEVSLDSDLIYDGALCNGKKKVKDFYNVMRSSLGFTTPGHSDVPYQESVDRLHNPFHSDLASGWMSPEKKNMKNSDSDNIKAQIADKDLSNSMSSNVTEDYDYRKKKKKGKKKHSAAVELESEAIHTDEIDNDGIEELGIVHSSGFTNNTEAALRDQKNRRKREKHSLNNDFQNIDLSVTNSIDKLKNSSCPVLTTEEFYPENKKQQIAERIKNVMQNEDKDLDNFLNSKANKIAYDETEDCNKRKSKKKKQKCSFGIELDNDNVLVVKDKTDVGIINLPYITTQADGVVGDQENFRKKKRKKHLFNKEFENMDFSVTNSVDKLQNLSHLVHTAEEIFPKKKKQQKADTAKNVAQNEDNDVDNFLKSNATKTTCVTEDCDNSKKKKKKQKDSVTIELENEVIQTDKIDNDVIEESGVVYSSGITNNEAALKDLRKKKKHLLNDEFKNMNLSVTNSTDKLQNSSCLVHTPEEILPKKKKQQMTETAKNVTQNKVKNLDNFLNSNATKAADVAEDCDYRKKKRKKRKDSVSIELENDNVLIDKDKTDVGIINPSDITAHIDGVIEDPENFWTVELNPIEIMKVLDDNVHKTKKKNDVESSVSDEIKNATIVENMYNPADVANTHEKHFSSQLESESDSDVIESTPTTHFIAPVLGSEEDPVDFTIPELHASESVSPLSKEMRASFESKGIKIKGGKWLNSEDDILRRNYNKFCHEFQTNDPYILLGMGQCRRNAEIIRFLKAKHFYVRLAEGLNNRTLNSVYTRARTLFHPLKDGKKCSQEDVSYLKEAYKRYGNKWNQIGGMLDKNPSLLRQSHRWNEKPVNKGRWKCEEEENLISAVKTVAKTSELSPKLIKRISWEKVAELVPTRNASQCRLHWGEYMAFDPEVTRSTWDKSMESQLLEIIKNKHLNNETEIDWEEIYESFKDVAPSYMFLQKIYRRLKSSNKHFLTMNSLFVRR